MQKPPELEILLEELRERTSPEDSSVTIASEDAKAIVFMHAEDRTGITFSACECRLLLNTAATVREMFEALGEPVDSSLNLVDVILTDSVQDCAESLFTAVDEGI